MKNNLTNLLFDRIKSRLPHRATADGVTIGGDEPIILNFVKLVDRWYADVPGWTGSIPQLEMVAGADDLLDYMSQHTQFVSVCLSLEEKTNAVHLEKICNHFGGADYRVVNCPDCGVQQIWLCGVNNIYWGGYSPEHIWFSLNTDHPNNA